jgi:hypothetical protein
MLREPAGEAAIWQASKRWLSMMSEIQGIARGYLYKKKRD